jgi:2'-hydroxyisoflavone reductase
MRENVAAWSEMPLWIPEQEAQHLKGYMFLNSQKAIDSGLSFRPLQETANDILTWREMDGPDKELKAGIAPDREQRLLLKWHKKY